MNLLIHSSPSLPPMTFYIDFICARLCLKLQYPLSVSSTVPGPERAIGKIPQQPPKGMFTAPPSLPQESTQPWLAPGALPLTPARNQSWRHWVRNLGTNCHSSGITASRTPGSGSESQRGPVSQLSWGTLVLPLPLCAALPGEIRECRRPGRGSAGVVVPGAKCFSVQIQTSGWASKPLESGSITTEGPAATASLL